MLLRQHREEDAPRPRSLVSEIPLDLDTICLKCLEKDPRRRYQSAEQLADDLRRFLDHEPILARPISAARSHVALVPTEPGCRRADAGRVVVACRRGRGLRLLRDRLEPSGRRESRPRRGQGNRGRAGRAAKERGRSKRPIGSPPSLRRHDEPRAGWVGTGTRCRGVELHRAVTARQRRRRPAATSNGTTGTACATARGTWNIARTA